MARCQSTYHTAPVVDYRLPDPGHTVRVEGHVRADNRNALDLGLDAQQPIKGVFVMLGQHLNGRGVFEFDLEQNEVVAGDLSGQQNRRRFPQLQLAQPRLDSDLPARCHADQLAVGRGYDGRFRGRTQQRVVPQEPEQRVRVEQERHSMYSLNSSSGASKSGAIHRILSFADPAAQGQLVRSVRTSLASGWPLSIRTTSSPGWRLVTISRR